MKYSGAARLVHLTSPLARLLGLTLVRTLRHNAVDLSIWEIDASLWPRSEVLHFKVFFSPWCGVSQCYWSLKFKSLENKTVCECGWSWYILINDLNCKRQKWKSVARTEVKSMLNGIFWRIDVSRYNSDVCLLYWLKDRTLKSLNLNLRWSEMRSSQNEEVQSRALTLRRGQYVSRDNVLNELSHHWLTADIQKQVTKSTGQLQ